MNEYKIQIETKKILILVYLQLESLLLTPILLWRWFVL